MTRARESSARRGEHQGDPWRRSSLLAGVQAGLARRPRSLPSALFYDARGSQLFQWITNLPEYYLTRCEREILEAHGEAIVAPVARGRCTVVDLGAGDGHKTQSLLRRLVAGGAEVTYAPVDISPAALDVALERVCSALPDVGVRPVRATYERALRLLAGEADAGPKLVLFLGSSIGNLEHEEASRFLVRLRRALRPADHVLVGFDLVKPLSILRRAYDDPQGLTRAFNLNVLSRINRELGADFDLQGFQHVATWDPGRPAMESWLESVRPQTVQIGPAAHAFAAGERLHTEISCKYTGAQLTGFAARAGFVEAGRFTDREGWFADALWRAGP